MHASKLKIFAQRYGNAWCSGDPARVADFFAPNGWLAINGGAPSVGRVAITEAARGFMNAFPDMHVSFDRLVENSDLVDFHWTLTGTNTGMGGTGKRVRISGFESWKLGTDGLIAESKGSFDSADYERQLRGRA
jgi:predicted ester cyclase